MLITIADGSLRGYHSEEQSALPETLSGLGARRRTAKSLRKAILGHAEARQGCSSSRCPRLGEDELKRDPEEGEAPPPLPPGTRFTRVRLYCPGIVFYEGLTPQ